MSWMTCGPSGLFSFIMSFLSQTHNSHSYVLYIISVLIYIVGSQVTTMTTSG